VYIIYVHYTSISITADTAAAIPAIHAGRSPASAAEVFGNASLAMYSCGTGRRQ